MSRRSDNELTDRVHVSKIVAAIACGAAFLFLVIAGAYKFLKTPSGTILWSHEFHHDDPDTAFLFQMALRGDFLYIVGGNGRGNAGETQWCVEKRRVSDGALVSGFGEGGIIKGGYAPQGGYATGVAVDSRFLYIVGMGRVGDGDLRWRIEKRKSSDGSFEEGFGNGGVLIGEPALHLGNPKAIFLEDPFLYVVGTEKGGPDASRPRLSWGIFRLRIEKRYQSDGSLEFGFGNGGVFNSDPEFKDRTANVRTVSAVLLKARHLYVVSTDYLPFTNPPRSDTGWRMEKRRLADGSLTEEYGTGGCVNSNPSPGRDSLHGIAFDDAYTYTVGFETVGETPWDTRWRIEKRTLSDGSYAGGFGTGGAVTSDPSGRVDMPFAIALDAEPGLWKRLLNLDFFGDPRCMYVVGMDEAPGKRDQQWRIEKRKADSGAIWTEFGNNGVITVNPSYGLEEARLVAADADHIYVAGFGPNYRTSTLIKIKK